MEPLPLAVTIPELVSAILRHADRASLLCSLRVNRTWAACCIEILYEELQLNSQRHLESLLKCLERQRARRDHDSGFLNWLTKPTIIKKINLSKWRYRKVPFQFTDGIVLAVFEEMAGLASLLAAQFDKLASELSDGIIIKGHLRKVVLPKLDSYVARVFDALVNVDARGTPLTHEAVDFLLSRLFFVSPDSLLALLHSSPDIESIDACHDIGIKHLLHAASSNLFNNLRSLSLQNNLAKFSMLPQFRDSTPALQLLEGLSLAPIAHFGGASVLIDTPISALVDLFKSLRLLEFLDLGFHGAPVVALLAALHCPLKTLRSRVGRTVVPDPVNFQPWAPFFNDQTVLKLIEVSETLEELDVEIGLGNAAFPGSSDFYESCGMQSNTTVQTKLRKLKLVYDSSSLYVSSSFDTFYDPTLTPPFLNNLLTSTAHTLTHLELHLPFSGAHKLWLVDFSVCTALESVNLGIWEIEATALLQGTQRYRGSQFPTFCPGEQFRGSQGTLKKLELAHVVVMRLDMFLMNRLFEECDGMWIPSTVIEAGNIPAFEKLEELSLSFVDLYKDPVLFWLGRCPSLRLISGHGLFRIPERCSFLGHARMRLRLEGPDMPAVLDPSFSSPSLKFAERAELTLGDLRDKVIRAFEPCLESAVRLRLFGWHGPKYLPDVRLRWLLKSVPRLEALALWYHGIGNGTLKAIAETAPDSLKEVELSEAGLWDVRSRRMRVNAIEGFLVRLTERCKVPPKFRFRYEVLGRPFREAVVEHTRAGRKGDLEISKERHWQSFLAQRRELFATVKRLGIDWFISEGIPDLESERERELAIGS